MTLIFFFLHLRSEGQEVMEKLSFTVPLKERKVTSNEIVSVILKIDNRQKTKSTAWIKVGVDKQLQLLSKDSIWINLAAGDSTFLPVKIFIPEKTPFGLDYQVDFSMRDLGGEVHHERCRLILEQERNVMLAAQVSTIVLDGVNDSISIPVRISNKGNNKQKINLISRFPSALQSDGFHSTMQITMEAFADTVVFVKKKATRELINFDEFTVNITGAYMNGNIFGVGNVSIQTLKNIRHRDNDPVSGEKYLGNYKDAFSMVTQNFGSKFAAYQIMGGGAVDLPESRIGYNIDATIFKNSLNSPYFRDTFLSFEKSNFGFSAGNITRNFDLNLNGRGATAFFTDTATLNNFEVGYIDNSSNLIAPNNYRYDAGRSAWAKIEHRGTDLKIKSTLVYNKDPFVQVNNFLIGNEIKWYTKSKYRISGSLNVGRTSDYTDAGYSKMGLLGGMSFDGVLGSFSVSADNLISSPYYSGLRKGMAIFSERLTYNLKGMNIWSGFNYLKSEPKFISSFMTFSTKYQNSRTEIGVSRIWGNWSVSLAPTYQTEAGTYYLSADEFLEADLISKRLVTQISYNAFQQSLFLNVDAGFVKSSLSIKSESQFKINGSYRYKMFNIATNLQYGNFFVNEFFNNSLPGNKKYTNLNITPTVRRSFFSGKIKIEGGLSYNKISNAGKTVLLTGRGEYNVSQKTQLFASLARSQYNFNQYRYEYNNLQFGLIQKIPNAMLGNKNSTLEVNIYKDENQNGIYDPGDSVARSQVVYINGFAFITDKKGKVIYKNLPDGNYTITAANQGQWYAPEQKVIVRRKDLKVTFGMAKTGTLKGAISYSYNEYSYDINREMLGIGVEATSENGEVTRTKTDGSGQFVFYLPTGNYFISVSPESLPGEVECSNNQQHFKVDQKTTNKVSFDLVVKSRRVESKKFISKSLKK